MTTNWIYLGPALVGHNLNLCVVRGFATLADLARVSRADVYDQVMNPAGTQRELNKKHAQQCFEYAAGSLGVDADADPRAFPEVACNVRQDHLSVLRLVELDEETEIAPESLAELLQERVALFLHVYVDGDCTADAVSISRLDGNHRLHGAELAGNLDAAEDVVIPYALFVNLRRNQEAELFIDFNNEHKGMEAAHLLTLRASTQSDLDLMSRDLALWLARSLSAVDEPFDGVVFHGGSKRGVTAEFKATGGIPRLKISTLRSALDKSLRASAMTDKLISETSEDVATRSRAHSDDPSVSAAQVRAAMWKTIHERYWRQVRSCFGDCWNPSTHHLLTNIGISGFAQFASFILENHLAKMNSGDVAYLRNPAQLDALFRDALLAARSVDLRKDAWSGVAGAGGESRMLLALKEAFLGATPGKATLVEDILKDLVGNVSEGCDGVDPE